MGHRAAARLTLPRPDSRSMIEGISPCLARLSPRQITSRPGAAFRAASALNRQLRLTGSEKSSQFRATEHSIATISPIMPTAPQGIALRERPAEYRHSGSAACAE